MADIPVWFERNLGLLSAAQQHTLGRGRVAVIGCGGLGGYLVEELVRLGVGRLHLFDPDTFSPTNINRQLLAVQAPLGRSKAEVAAERAAAIHPCTVTRVFPTDFRRAGDEALRVDVVVDCLDDIPARRDLGARCRALDLPLVHGAVTGWYGQVGVQRPGDDLLDRLYPARTVRPAAMPPPVLACTVAVVASLQAAETLKLLLGLPSPLANSWLHVDLLDCSFEPMG